jgi:predicted transposase/invertase (TIGR01784 family)
MRTDKLYYQIFLAQPALLADLIPGLPADCAFEYVAPVVKESEFRLDGLLVPLSDDLTVPVIFLEAQMQSDSRFYGRYFAETYLYLYQYQVDRSWRGLLILQSRQQGLGSEAPYTDLLEGKVQRIYLQDLLHETQLPPALALLQLLVLPNAATAQAAQSLLRTVKPQGEEAFQQMLNLVEAILVNRFPQLTTQEILAMLDIKTADIRQTRFYQEVLQEGREEGREEGRQEGRQEAEATLLIRFLARRFESLSEAQVLQIRALSLAQLDALSEVLFDLADLAALDNWLQAQLENMPEAAAEEP